MRRGFDSGMSPPERGETLAMIGLLLFIACSAAAVLSVVALAIVRDLRRPPRRGTAWAMARRRPIEPDDLGLKCEPWTLDRPDGARLDVWEIASKDRPRRTIVFVHDWGSSRIELLPSAPAWQSLGDRLVLYDARGHGDADAADSDLGARHDVDDLRALLARLNDARTVLIGFGQGGLTALLAVTDTERESGAREGVASSAPTARSAAVVAIDPFPDPLTPHRRRLQALGYPVVPFVGPAFFLLRSLGVRGSAVGAAARLNQPLLIVHRDAPAPVDVATCRAIADAASGGQFEEIAVDDGRKEKPDALLERIRGFLDRSDSVAAS